jgi:Flp pilus assembly protein TadG
MVDGRTIGGVASRLPRRWRPRRAGRTGSPGQALMEMALVLPVLVLLVMGLVDFGRAIYAYNTVAEAARNGSRVAMVNQNSSDICSVAAGRAVALGLPTSCQPSTATVGVFVSPTAAPGCGSSGCYRVTVTYRFTPLTPIIGSFLGPITLQSTSTVPIEHPCTGGGCPTT